MLNAAPEALKKGMRLRPADTALLIRTLWVIVVSLLMARMMGWLTVFGIASPFAKAADVDKLLRAAEASARINMQQELRVQTRVWCSNPDAEVRDFAYRRIEDLRRDLLEIARLPTPEPSCAASTPTDR